MNRMNWQEEKDMIKELASSFPETFRLRAFPNDTFKILEQSSYYSESRGEILLYIGILKNGEFLAFDKDSASALRKEIVK